MLTTSDPAAGAQRAWSDLEASTKALASAYLDPASTEGSRAQAAIANIRAERRFKDAFAGLPSFGACA